MEQLSLQCSACPNDIYITKNAEIYDNAFRLVLVTRPAASPFARLEAPSVDGTPAITITSDWENAMNALCTLGEAAGISLECDGWRIFWKETGWLLKPPSGMDLDHGFVANLSFSSVVTTALEGTALLSLCLFNFPGFPSCAPFVATLEKRYPIRIDSFAPSRKKLEPGETGSLSWSVSNCKTCYLSGQQVKPQDTMSVQLTAETQSFFLTAHNEFARVAGSQITLVSTNWRELGSIPSAHIPLGEELSHCNCKMHHSGSYYLLCGGVLYESASIESLSWSVCSTAPIPDRMKGFYDTAIFQNTFWIVGETDLLRYSFTDKKWESLTTELRTGSQTACRVCSFQKRLIHGAVLGKSKLLFSQWSHEEGEWSRDWFLDVRESMSEIAAFDLAEFHGALYVALQSPQKDRIYIYTTGDLEDWKIWGEVAALGDWFHLLHTANRLFLLTPEKNVDLGGGSILKDFPVFPVTANFPYACCEGEWCYLAVRGETENCFYRFRP